MIKTHKPRHVLNIRHTRFFFTAVAMAMVAVSAVDRAAAQRFDTGLSFNFEQLDFRRLNMGVRQLVFASGEIKPGDLARLTAFNAENAVRRGAVLVLDSPGGNMFEAMGIARYIRSVGMDTWVGSKSTATDAISGSGRCYSACTLLFLGGLHRSVSAGSTFGVHRFFWADEEEGGTDEAQVLFGKIVSFMKEMGIDPELSVEMSRSGRAEVNILSAETMARLGVTTPSFETEWSVEPVDHTFIVRSVTRDPRGRHELTFTCSTRGKDGHAHLMMIAGFDAGDAAQTVVAGLKKEQFILSGGRFVDLTEREIPDRELLINPIDHRHVDSFIRISPRLLALMDGSTELGIAYQMSDGMTYAGFTGSLTENAKRDIHGVLDSCP